jgi:hypothetical protein
VQQTLSFHTKKEGFATGAKKWPTPFSSQGAVLLPNKALQSFQNQQRMASPKILKAELKISNFPRIGFRVPQLSAAVTGCPNGIEFKLFDMC